MSLLHRFLTLSNFRTPLLRTLVPCIGTAFALQGLVAIPSILLQSERFYDLSGSLTYISVTALSLYLPALRARAAASAAGLPVPSWPGLVKALAGSETAAMGAKQVWNWRQVVISGAVCFWATRLGTYLYTRILSDKTDSRFDTIRSSPGKFLLAFLAQGTWISICLLPILTLNAVPSSVFLSLSSTSLLLTDVLGLGLYISGLTLEVVADRQKSAWSKAKKEKKHSEEFMTSGLWSRSRHPNYFGESMLWTGMAVAAAGVLCRSAAVKGLGLGGLGGGKMVMAGVCAASPAFVTFLLLKVSGVPLSEGKYDQRFGDRKEYREWKEKTPVFVPKIW